ncbi:hypothetical protein EST38_g11423 [Candolleomyces aberdarensis]|uniref:Uncharacterized protein n=1 Tax=Candolleomyces aberdarensis TaxID=2316362 RepID=A0A4Q2D872_9AGAR|nr:hypothetical protein EST38_g11423 [Candolleomyces aberdarensis]
MFPGQTRDHYEQAAFYNQEPVWLPSDFQKRERILHRKEEGDARKLVPYLLEWIGEYTRAPQTEIIEWQLEVFGVPWDNEAEHVYIYDEETPYDRIKSPTERALTEGATADAVQAEEGTV